MRDLKRNQRVMYYALHSSSIGATTSYYLPAVKFEAYLSNGKGSSQDEPFGNSTDYDRVISTVDKTIPITETTLIWHESEPVVANGKTSPNNADYKVAAKPLNGLDSVVIAIKSTKKTNSSNTIINNDGM